MKLGPHRPKLSLRINGTRAGDSARPEPTNAPAPARTIRRVPPPALVIRDYRDTLEDTGVGS